MPLRLPLSIPQVEDVDVEGDERLGWQPWARYVTKASERSEKITHILRYAGRALAEAATGQRGWDDCPIDAYWAALAATIPKEPPFASTEAFVDALVASGHVPPATTPQAAREADVIRAAAALCHARWSGATFTELCDEVMWGFDCDPVKAVAAVLFLLCGWSATPII